MVSVNLDARFIDKIKDSSLLDNRSIPKQIIHHARIGELCVNYPKLTYNEILNEERKHNIK